MKVSTELIGGAPDEPNLVSSISASDESVSL